MVRGSFTVSMVLVALAGCPGGNGGIGAICGGIDDCSGSLQCLNNRCERRCERAPDCGDGYACDPDGLCQPATGQAGDKCMSEVECAAGLSCQINGAELDGDNRLLSLCTAEGSTHAAGAECRSDDECRNGTCALGHCIDLCRQTRDCGSTTSCEDIPTLPAGALFSGCLPSHGVVAWQIPVVSSLAQVLLPVPSGTSSVELVMSVDDDNQKVGATSVISPAGTRLYNLPCSPLVPSKPPCDQTLANDMYFTNPIRHLPAFGQSVLAIPSGSPAPQTLSTGVYRVEVASFRSDDLPGSGLPRVSAVLRIGTGATLDLHFFFLDLSDHPCATNGATLDAAAAQSAAFFQDDYLGQLGSVFDSAALALGALTFEDIKDHPELDGLDVADAGSLLKLGSYKTGINVFFVRSLSPIGLQAFGPNPGPAGLASTRQSGIVIGLDTLCYRTWSDLARLTAHELARYMGLYHNVELETPQHGQWQDQIDDDGVDPSTNLMYFSESASPGVPAGSVLSAHQRELLTRSPVLQ